MSKTSKIENKTEHKTEHADGGAVQEAPKTEDHCESVEDLTRILEARLAEAQKRAAELQSENSELKDQYLRKLADYENFRKRMFREKEEAVQFANSVLLQDLLDILDDLDRAVSSSEITRDFQVLHDGIVMVRNRMLSTLEGKYGLSRYDSAGSAFDPNIHEAVAMEKGSVEDPVVLEEFQKGYKLHGRVLRAARVKVKMPDGSIPASPASQGNPPETADGGDPKPEGN